MMNKMNHSQLLLMSEHFDGIAGLVAVAKYIIEEMVWM